MPRLIKPIFILFSALSFILLPHVIAGNKSDKHGFLIIPIKIDPVPVDSTSIMIDLYYDSLKLGKFGLKKEIFAYAYTGYHNLYEAGVVKKKEVLTICDFSQSAKRKRLYLIDLSEFKLLLNTHVAHGRNSGNEYAKKFSNKPESLQSSLGFYLTKNTYYGGHGLALTISGLEKGFNDKAERRKIVVHGSDYIGDTYLRYSRSMGRSFGCPAIPKKFTSKLINIIKNGSCFFIYHPTKNYLTNSKILNDKLDI